MVRSKYLYSLLTVMLLALLISYSSFAQADSCRLRISVLTCSPGEELYSIFGHTAMRVTDGATGRDIVFNYGTFDFDEPGFYIKFIRGKLNYFLSVEDYAEFIQFYQYDQRGITEQVLDIPCEQKQILYKALVTNLQGSNRYYKYDFLFDNCTSRIRDQIQHNVSGVQMQSRLTEPGTTFRNMIHGYLDKGGQPWSKLGIDIFLGSKMDRPVTINESMFLPDFLMMELDSARQATSGPLLSSSRQVLTPAPFTSKQNKWMPLLIFSIIAFCILLLSQLKNKAGRVIIRLIDSLLLYLTGLAGILLLIMWFATDHVACANNWNLLWALPTNFVAAFYLWKKPVWVKKYFTFAGFLQISLLLGWIFLPQHLNIALVPIVLIMAYRHFQLAAN